MKTCTARVRMLLLLVVFIVAVFALSGCAPKEGDTSEKEKSRYLVAIEEEPDTVDFHSTTIHYTIATNVFNRLVETEVGGNGNVAIKPSLAESWHVSDGGRTYTFRLRKGVKFSNGEELTSADVKYSFERVLTYPESSNQDIMAPVKGAEKLMKGEAKELEGFKIKNDLEFSITLEEPFEAFLACLSMPAASIMDEKSARNAGDKFGKDPNLTIGTGFYILKRWKPGKGMVLVANKDCWQGPPNNPGMRLLFLTEPEEIRMLFEEGKLDVMDLDDISSAAEYYTHGDIYQNRLHKVSRIGITYIALNEDVKPLNKVKVRKALQMALDRDVLLAAVYGGEGSLENGIMPIGLYGYNPDLPKIPYSPKKARKLLAEAGYPNGFDMTFAVKSSSTENEMTLARLAVSMWEKVGVRAKIKVMSEDEFMKLRKSGDLPSYSATWTADYNDPDNFLYTFFGNNENARFRSLCYKDEDIMKRVRDARLITDPNKRLKEYRDLEKLIVQDDAAWIPLFSRLRLYMTAERIKGFKTSWNGSVKNEFRCLYLENGK